MSPDSVPEALQLAVAWATVAGAGGVVLAGIGLLLQWLRTREERREGAAQAVLERERFERQIAALQQAENDRLAAQARRIVPSLIRASVVMPDLWHVRIDNASTEVISLLHVDVYAVDDDGQRVVDGCEEADRTEVGQAMGEFFAPAITQMYDVMTARFRHFIEQVRAGVIELGDDPSQIGAFVDQMAEGTDIDPETASMLREQAKHIAVVNLTDEWLTVLSPGQFTARGFVTKPGLQPRVYMRFEESDGYTWERTDITKPTRVLEPPAEIPSQTARRSPKHKWWNPATWF
jgi:hypothetical protein